MIIVRRFYNFQQALTTCLHNTSQGICTAQSPLFAGHSKWANIRHIKAQKDGQKSAIFTRLARQIRFAIQEGGSAEPALNSKLRTVLDEAQRKSMPMATIQNNIKKFLQNKTTLKKYVLDIRFKQKVFVKCILYTDNYPLFKIEVATILRKSGACFVDTSHLFEDFGLVEATFAKVPTTEKCLEEEVTEDAIECGAEEVEVIDAESGHVNFICSPLELNSVRNAIEGKGYKIANTEHIYAAKNAVNLTPEELNDFEKFASKLREINGVEDIYDNIQID